MTRYLIPIVLLISLLTGLEASAQPSRTLTLEDAMNIARDHSPDALNARQQFRISYWDYRSFRASNLPSLTLSSTPQYGQGYYSYFNSITQVPEYYYQQSLTTQGALSLTQQIGVTGGTLAVSSGINGQFNYVPDTTFINTNPLILSLSQPLFRFNSYRWDRKIQPLAYSAAKQKFLENMEQISRNTVNYFFMLLKAQVNMEIARVNLAYYDTVYTIAEGRYQVGKIAENDLLLLELNDLRARASLENARINLDNALYQFRSYLRIKDTIPINLIPPSDVDFFTVSPQEAISLAKTNSSAYMEFERRLLEAARDVNRAKMDGRFDALITAGIGYTGNAADLEQSYKNLSNYQSAGVTITIPIYDWGVSRGQIKKAESQQEIVRNSVEQEMIDFERNVYLKVMQFNLQQVQVSIAARSDTVARKNFEVTKGRYLIGKLTDILVLSNAQVETDGSRLGYYDALMTYWDIFFDLRKTTLFDFQSKRPLQFQIRDIGL